MIIVSKQLINVIKVVAKYQHSKHFLQFCFLYFIISNYNHLPFHIYTKRVNNEK